MYMGHRTRGHEFVKVSVKHPVSLTLRCEKQCCVGGSVGGQMLLRKLRLLRINLRPLGNNEVE